MSPNLHPMINVAVKAARAAGSIINRAALDVEAVRISQKQVNDFVTDVDQAAEAAIIETLLTAYPGHGIWAEESGREHGAKDSECLVGIVGPDREATDGIMNPGSSREPALVVVCRVEMRGSNLVCPVVPYHFRHRGDNHAFNKKGKKRFDQ